MLNLLLHNNIFEFNNKLFSQENGAAMGGKPAPNYANIFMARKVDGKIKQLSEHYNKNYKMSLNFMLRFLDDIFKIFIGTSKELHKLFEQINKIHQNIKFTISHTTNPNERDCDKCNCPSQMKIPFLDTSCEITEGKIVLDL